MRQPLSVPLDRLALGCIDLQEEHRQDARYLVEGYDRVLANVATLQRTARELTLPVYHWAYVVDVDQPRPNNPVDGNGQPIFSPRGHPLTEICPEVAPALGEHLTIKSEASAFGRTSLMAQAIQDRGVEWLMVAGVWTEACVDATIKDAVAAGLRVLLVKDACGSGTRDMHRAAVLNIANRLYGGGVIDTDGACRLMQGEQVDVWQVQGSIQLRYTFSTADATYDEL